MGIEPSAMYKTDSREIHMLGNAVAACWNLRKEVTASQDQDSWIQQTRLVRSGEPYIDFVWMRQDSHGIWYEDEDSPVSAGIASARQAMEIAYELLRAVEYLSELVALETHKAGC